MKVQGTYESITSTLRPRGLGRGDTAMYGRCRVIIWPETRGIRPTECECESLLAL